MFFLSTVARKWWRRFGEVSLVVAVCLSSVGRGDIGDLPSPELSAEQVANIDRYVTAEMGREHIPGMVVGVYHRGQVLMAKGYGLANIELNVPMRPEMLLQTGSVGKQFVAAAVMMLVEEGKIGLDDSIVRYFPNAPTTWKPILVKNLLSHTSGLAEYASDERTGPKGPFYMRLDFTEDELLEKTEALPIDFQVGEKWGYRNTNYLLLGILIHKVTGKFFADYLAERIFKPLGMKSTRLINNADIVPNRVSGYDLLNGRVQNQNWQSPTFNSTADGVLYSSVFDLAKWDEALYGSSLLQRTSLDRMWTVFPLNDGEPNPGNYGFGWIIYTVNGHKVIQHDGGWQGFTCDIARYVDDTTTVVVLMNLDTTFPGMIARDIAGLVNPTLMPKTHRKITVDPKVFDGYVGRYDAGEPSGVVIVTREGDHLFAQSAADQPKVELFPESDREYFYEDHDEQISFAIDSQGRTNSLTLHSDDGMKLPANRIESERTPAEQK